MPRTSRKTVNVIYRMLKESVEHIANMLLHGDVCGLEAEMQKWVTRALFKFKTLETQDSSPSFDFGCRRRDSSSFICKVLLSCVADAVEGTCSILFLKSWQF